jgi:uncharacterized membrane protein YesL
MNKIKQTLMVMFSKPLRIAIFFAAFFVVFYASSSHPGIINSVLFALITALVLSAWNAR